MSIGIKKSSLEVIVLISIWIGEESIGGNVIDILYMILIFYPFTT